MRLQSWLWISSLLGCGQLFAALPAIQLSSLSQHGAQVGTEVSLHVVSGGQLDEVERLVFSAPGIASAIELDAALPFTTEPRPKYGRFRVTIPAEIESGFYEIRAVGRLGISNPRAMWIDKSPHILATTLVSASPGPPPLPIGSWVHDRCVSALRKQYTLDLKAGQFVTVQTLARLVDSRAAIQLELIDQRGRVVASAYPLSRRDQSLKFSIPADGVYTLRAFDSQFQGGDDFHYAIRAEVGAAPTHDESAIVKQLVDAEIAESRWLVGAVTPGQSLSRIPGFRGLGNAWRLSDASLILGNAGEAADVQWLKPGANALDSSLGFASEPLVVRGVFDPSSRLPQSIDWTSLTDQTCFVRLGSQRFGCHTDPLVTIYQLSTDDPPKLEQVGQQDDLPSIGSAPFIVGTKDAELAVSMKNGARYRAVIKDFQRGTRPAEDRTFSLSLSKPNPAFTLLAAIPFATNDPNQSQPVGVHMMRGGALSIRVIALRHDGFVGPIEVSIANLPTGFTASRAFIAAGQDQVVLILTSSETVQTSVFPIEVLGTALIGEQSVTKRALAAAIQWSPMSTESVVQTRLTDRLYASVREGDLSSVEVTLSTPESLEVPIGRGKTASIPVNVKRREGNTSNIVVRPQNFTDKITCKEVTVDGAASAGVLEVTVAADAPLGSYTIWSQCETKVKNRMNPQAFARAEQYKKQLDALRVDPQFADRIAEIDAALATANQMIEQAKPGQEDREYPVFLPSNHITLVITE